MTAKPAAAFYCMSSDVYFLGAVAMINSLRLQGHGEPIHLLDLGLEPWQRELLAPEVGFVEAPAGIQPWLAKTVAPLAHPAETMVLIDGDMVCTRPLTELVERARDAGVAAFEDRLDRHLPEWGELLDLGPLCRGPYVSSGLVALGGGAGAEVLRLLDERQRRVDPERAIFAHGDHDDDYPLLYLDQDVLNAVLCAERTAVAADVLPYRLAPSLPPYEGLRIVDLAALRCQYADGTEPFAVHHILPEKPWLRPMYDSIYSRLLKRALSGEGLAIRVPAGRLPLRLRTGPIAYAERRRVDAAVRLRWHLGIALERMRTRVGS